MMKKNRIQKTELRPCLPSEANTAYDIICQARQRMFDEGRRQWTDAYPAISDIRSDIAGGHAMVLTEDDEIVAYGAVFMTPDPTYSVIEGKWLTDNAYVVVHRLATADAARGRHIAERMLTAVCDMARCHGLQSMRIDTNHDNGGMLHVLGKLGFSRCGIITLLNGGKRIAFEKVL